MIRYDQQRVKISPMAAELREGSPSIELCSFVDAGFRIADIPVPYLEYQGAGKRQIGGPVRQCSRGADVLLAAMV